MKSEDTIQAAIVAYIKTVAPDVIVYAIPNAALRRTPGPTGKAKAGNAVPGLRRGAFDLGLVLPDGRAAFIECKAARGVMSTFQLGFQALLKRRGIPHAVCRSIDEARIALALWGVRSREAA